MTGTPLANALLEHLCRGAAHAAPTSVELALYVVAPASDGSGGTEASGTSYVRKTLACNTTNWAPAAGGQITNAVAIDWGTVGAGGWGSVTAVGVRDNNGVWWGSSPIPVANLVANATFKLNAGALVLNFPLD
jgi:hypothetical protein